MRYAVWTASGLGLASIAFVLFPLIAGESETRAYGLYTIGAWMAVLASLLALVSGFALLFKRGGRLQLFFCAVALVAAT